MKNAVARTIYNSYNLWEDYEEIAKENLRINNIDTTEANIWDEIVNQDLLTWEDEQERLEEFFNNGNTWIIQGYTGRWDGTYKCGFIFTDFMKMLADITEDCDYLHLYDVNGHFYIECSHHDGTNTYEVRKVTDKGINYLENWEYNYNDDMTEEYIHDKIMEKYSTLPHFAHTVYSCPKVEYKKVTA